ncbi:NTP transferase domain-containing protein, partial [uncultured Brachyspira sp.]|uniref:NTP transferase domain-containing protein n=1 Tax=uncultured Brachyspira sp. TaxID=221953 RepID=UPI0025950AF7
MNKIEQDILLCLKQDEKITQRDLSKKIGCSVGMVNKSINNLYKDQWLNELGQLTDKALLEINKNKPQSAIILAAGKGLRMVPINKDISKGFLKIKGTTIIENIIEKLIVVGIRQIVIVVGYRKEEYEYLIDKYNVKLIVNPHYNEKNNFYSFYLARKYLCNSYIIPCDIWCKKNPFSRNELYSW